MTANITVTVKSDEGLLVPLEAVNFKMTEEIMKKEGIEPSQVAANNKSSHHVWLYTDGKPVQTAITTGLNDGINYVVKSGLNAGDEVILSATLGKKKNTAKSARNPLMPSGPRR